MSSSRDDFGIAFRSALLQRGAAQKFSLVFLLIISSIIFFLDAFGFGFMKLKLLISRKKIINANTIKNTNENLCAAPFCKRAERKAMLKSSLLEDIYLFKTN